MQMTYVENTVFTVVSFDGWQYVFTETPDYHSDYDKAFKEFQDLLKKQVKVANYYKSANLPLGDTHEPIPDPIEIALVAYPSPTHLKQDKYGEIVACTPNWHEVSGRWVD